MEHDNIELVLMIQRYDYAMEAGTHGYNAQLVELEQELDEEKDRVNELNGQKKDLKITNKALSGEFDFKKEGWERKIEKLTRKNQKLQEHVDQCSTFFKNSCELQMGEQAIHMSHTAPNNVEILKNDIQTLKKERDQYRDQLLEVGVLNSSADVFCSFEVERVWSQIRDWPALLERWGEKPVRPVVEDYLRDVVEKGPLQTFLERYARGFARVGERGEANEERVEFF